MKYSNVIFNYENQKRVFQLLNLLFLFFFFSLFLLSPLLLLLFNPSHLILQLLLNKRFIILNAHEIRFDAFINNNFPNLAKFSEIRGKSISTYTSCILCCLSIFSLCVSSLFSIITQQDFSLNNLYTPYGGVIIRIGYAI